MELDGRHASVDQYLDLHDPEDTLLAAEDAKFSTAKSMLASLSVLERSTIALEAGIQSSSLEAHRLLLLQKHEQHEKEAAVVYNAKIYAEKNAQMHIRKMLRKVVQEDHLFCQHPHAPVTPTQQDIQGEGSSTEPLHPATEPPDKPCPAVSKHTPKKHHAVGFGSGLKRMLSSPGCDKVQAKPGKDKEVVLGSRSKSSVGRVAAAAATMSPAAIVSCDERPRVDDSCDVTAVVQSDVMLPDSTQQHINTQSVCSIDPSQERQIPLRVPSELADVKDEMVSVPVSCFQPANSREPFKRVACDQLSYNEQPWRLSPDPQVLVSRSSSPAPNRCLPSLNYSPQSVDIGRMAVLKDANSPSKASRHSPVTATEAGRQRHHAISNDTSHIQLHSASPPPNCGTIKSRWSSSSPMLPIISSDSTVLPRFNSSVTAYPELARIGGSGGLLKFINQAPADQTKSKSTTLAIDVSSSVVRTHSADSAFVGQVPLHTPYMFEPMRKRRLKGLQHAGHANIEAKTLTMSPSDTVHIPSCN